MDENTDKIRCSDEALRYSLNQLCVTPQWQSIKNSEHITIALDSDNAQLELRCHNNHGALSHHEQFPLPLSLKAIYEAAARMQHGSSVSLGHGWQLETSARQCVHATHAPIALTEKETQLLAFLAQCSTAVTRETIEQTIWGYDDTTDSHTVETHIYRLRQKLAIISPHHEVIATHEGGYLLNRD